MALVQVVNNQVVPVTSTTDLAKTTSAAPGSPSSGIVHEENGVVVPGPAPSSSGVTEQNAGVLNNIIENLLNTEAQSVKDQYAGRAAEQTATGDKAESDAYNTAAQIAAGNADLVEASGKVQQFQEMRKAMQTIGEQRAVVAGAGFGNSGSALLLAQDSMRQAHLSDQMIGENSQLQASGFLQQSQAAIAESLAASTASDAAMTLSKGDAATSTLLKANASASARAISAAFPGSPQSNIANAAANDQPLSAADLEEEARQLTNTSGVTNNTSISVRTPVGPSG